MAVLVRKKVKVSKYDAFVDYPAWEESRHPRGGATNKGQFTFGPIATEPAVELEPEVVEVGGDEWNKDAALRPESEYEEAKPVLDDIATRAFAGSLMGVDEKVTPEDWDSLAEYDQEAAEEEWKKQSLDQEMQYQSENYHENGDALNDAKRQLIHEFENDAWGSHGEIVKSEWFIEAMDKLRESREKEGQSHIPYTNQQLWQAMSLKLQYRHHSEPEIAAGGSAIARECRPRSAAYFEIPKA
jgi:hypothetical protein